MTTEIKPNYRFLEVGETVLETDEWQSYTGNWFPLSQDPAFVGHVVGQMSKPCYRRKLLPNPEWNSISPGAGYRMMAPDEVIQNGDEFFYNAFNGWFPADDAGIRRRPTPRASGLAFRRAIEAGTGYRLLSSDETIVLGDELLINGEWRLTLCTSDKKFTPAMTGVAYRRKVALSPDPGAGYRLVRASEPIEEGDEYCDGGRWWPTTDGGTLSTPLEAGITYRRKTETATQAADPGPGYRLLGNDELLIAGDEFFNQSMDMWLVTTNAGLTAGKSGYSYRRKLAPDDSALCARIAELETQVRDAEAQKGVLEKTVRVTRQANSLLIEQKYELRKEKNEMQQLMLRNALRYFRHGLADRRTISLWNFVADITGLGSASAIALCRLFGWDPDKSASEPLPKVST